jgi:hypothetical protein
MARTGPEWVRVVDRAVSMDQEIKSIQDGLVALLVGKDKRLSMIAMLSCAATTAHMIGASKIEIPGNPDSLLRQAGSGTGPRTRKNGGNGAMTKPVKTKPPVVVVATVHTETDPSQKLVRFLYLLMRHELSESRVTRLVNDVPEVFHFGLKDLRARAEELAKKLMAE